MALSFAACAAPAVDAAQPLSGRQQAVLEVASDAEVEFGFVADLDVDSRGRVYVADAMGQVVVLDAEGRVERRIGAFGRGPGEFEGIRNVQVVEGDSLLVFDLAQARVTVYAPGAERPAYTTSLATGGMRPYMLRRIGGDRRMVAFFRAAFRQGDGRGPQSPRDEVLRLLNGDGSLVRDSVLAHPETEALLLYRGGAFAGVLSYPQARRNVVRVGRGGRLYRLWTDSATVQVASENGRTLEIIRPREERSHRPFTRGDADALVRELAEGSVTEAEAREMVDQKRITSWPLVHDFVLDDHDRIWIGYAPREDGGEVEWVGYGADGERIGSFRLPASVTVHRFHRGRLYTDVRDDLDVQTVAVFRLHAEAA